MWNKIKGWLAPPVFEDEDKTRVAYLLNIILLGLVPATAALGIATLWVLPEGDFRIKMVFILTLVFIGLYSLTKFRFIKLPSILLVLALWSAFTLVMFRLGGVRTPIYGIYIVIALLAGLLMGERIGIAVVAVTIFTGVGLYYAETVGLIAFSVENFPLPAMLAAHTFMLVITMMLIFAYVRQLTQTLKQLRWDEHRLTISNQELEVIKNTLEERVAARTRGLELVTTLSERLTGILDFDQLLVELVDQVKKGFDYYHAHIYILDQPRQDLIMAAGFGEAGAQMKAKGHHILLDAPTSLVARAARTGKVVNISNVRQSPDWLPNPILPDTRSEMAVPITVEGQVVGVLDVQQNKIDGFDESDADLLRSLANQVAVAIRNARLFDEVETALAEVRAVQQQYIVHSWQTSRSNAQDRERRYIQPGMPEVSEAVVEAAEKQTFVQKRPTIVSIDDVEGSPKLLIAPISLAGQTIGTLQLHKVDNEDASIFWTEQDLEFVETVLDQVAQTAENLRLFEETRERASYEQTVRQITDKLRAAPNLDALLETAARELGQRLGVRHTVLELGVTTMISPDKELINVMGKRNY